MGSGPGVVPVSGTRPLRNAREEATADALADLVKAAGRAPRPSYKRDCPDCGGYGVCKVAGGLLEASCGTCRGTGESFATTMARRSQEAREAKYPDDRAYWDPLLHEEDR